MSRSRSLLVAADLREGTERLRWSNGGANFSTGVSNGFLSDSFACGEEVLVVSCLFRLRAGGRSARGGDVSHSADPTFRGSFSAVLLCQSQRSDTHGKALAEISKIDVLTCIKISF